MTLLNYFKPIASAEPDDELSSLHTPKKFVSWNVNGLVNRMRSNRDWQGFSSWVTEHAPDVICLQEVKLTAACNSPDCVKGDGKPRDRGLIRDNTKPCREDFNLVNAKLNQKPFSNYQRIWSLSDWKYSGVLCLIKKPIKVLSSRFNLLQDAPAAEHHKDGRIILLEFENIHFLGTYSPNHGWDPQHWDRRDQWDRECAAWLSQRSEADCNPPEKRARPQNKPFIWMGDLNVASTDMDLSHPKWFRQQVQRIKNKPVIDCPPERVGQPGCADVEREGFERFIKLCNLVDAYRHLHPEGPPVARRDPVSNEILEFEIDNNHFSWRGAPGINDPSIGRFYAKGMRIDHALISSCHLEMISSAELIGSGADRKLFWGSDHSALVVTLKESEETTLRRRRLEDDSPPTGANEN